MNWPGASECTFTYPVVLRITQSMEHGSAAITFTSDMHLDMGQHAAGEPTKLAHMLHKTARGIIDVCNRYCSPHQGARNARSVPSTAFVIAFVTTGARCRRCVSQPDSHTGHMHRPDTALMQLVYKCMAPTLQVMHTCSGMLECHCNIPTCAPGYRQYCGLVQSQSPRWY
jgi:hypothetical protein